VRVISSVIKSEIIAGTRNEDFLGLAIEQVNGVINSDSINRIAPYFKPILPHITAQAVEMKTIAHTKSCTQMINSACTIAQSLDAIVNLIANITKEHNWKDEKTAYLLKVLQLVQHVAVQLKLSAAAEVLKNLTDDSDTLYMKIHETAVCLRNVGILDALLFHFMSLISNSSVQKIPKEISLDSALDAALDAILDHFEYLNVPEEP